MKKDISVEELKMIQLKILDSIDDFCKKNGIQYFLFSGTLIGAVRHKGYIPWDDDVDICMKRKDYNRFFSEFNQQRRDTLKAISAETEKNYYLASGKVIDTATVIEEENNCAMPIGVFVDIFPMDNLPSDDKKLKKLNHRIDIYRKMLILKSVPVSDRRSAVKNWILKVSSFLLKPISMQHIIRKITKLAVSYNDDATCNRIADISVLCHVRRRCLKHMMHFLRWSRFQEIILKLHRRRKPFFLRIFVTHIRKHLIRELQILLHLVRCTLNLEENFICRRGLRKI